MTATATLVDLAIAFGVGLLIGLERGWQLRSAADGQRVAGVRTFALIGLTGGILGIFAVGSMAWITVAGATGVIATLVMGYRASLRAAPATVSATATLVGVLTLLLGMLATTGHAVAAVVMGGSTTVLLSMRDKLHGWLKSLGPRDARAAAYYVVIACVILPLLPDKDLGPYGAWNPRSLWLVVVFVTGLSFAGYWAGKQFGAARGTVLSAAIGATYSSTAVSLELARRLRGAGDDAPSLNAGIAAASAMMPLRVLVLTAVLVPAALGWFAIGIGAAALFGVGYALWLARRAAATEHGAADGGAVATRNPFDFWPAVGFAGLVAAVMLASHWALEHFGHTGLVTLVGLTGLYDVDAAIISVGNLPDGAMAPRALGLLLTLPIFINTVWKVVLVVAIAGVARGLRASVPLLVQAVLIAAGAGVLRG